MENSLRYPVIENAKDIIINHINIKTSELYGENLPEFIKSRLDFELQSINNEAFATVYLIAKHLTDYTSEIGQYSGVRMSAGASFISFLLGISGINPLIPHYLCKSCKHIELIPEAASGFDLPSKKCIHCGHSISGDGHNIPFEVFGGLNGEKVPEIKVVTNSEDSEKGKQKLESILNDYIIVHAGIITKTNKLIKSPDGFVIIPIKFINDVPISYLDTDNHIAVTSQHYRELTDYYIVNIVGHKYIDRLCNLSHETGVSLDSIPMNDPGVYNAFYECNTETIYEFHTDFMINALDICEPDCFSDLVKISGLGHSVDAWENNARELLQNGTVKLREVISSRDDIFNYLLSKGVNREQSYEFMNDISKGNEYILTDDSFINANLPHWYLDSCKKIEYLFHKANCVQNVKMAVQMMWFKIYHSKTYNKIVEDETWHN